MLVARLGIYCCNDELIDLQRFLKVPVPIFCVLLVDSKRSERSSLALSYFFRT